MGKSKSRGPQLNSPQDLSAYEAELMGAPRIQAKALPSAIELEQGLMPMLQSHYFGTLGSGMQALAGMYGSLEQPSIERQGSYGNALIGMYGGMGARATDAAVAGLGADAQRNYNMMQQQAADELALGTSLSQQETDIAQGAARAAAEARGLNFSRQGSDLEILNTYNMGMQRQAQRRQYAGQALNAAQGMQQYGAQAYLNPAMQGSSIYSIPGLVSGAEGAIGNYGPQILQPESQYLQGIRQSRMQAQMAAQQASATRSAGMMSGIATLGAALIMCWVAREVYGKENPRWFKFREWMFTSAPEWFWDFYLENGPAIAEYISDKPMLKRIIRFGMDFVINRHEKRLSKHAYQS